MSGVSFGKLIFLAVVVGLLLPSACSSQYQTVITTTETVVQQQTITIIQQPNAASTIIEIVSVSDAQEPNQTINPAGPVIKITLKNIANESIVLLTATLILDSASGFGPYDYTFNVGNSNPFMPGTTISQTQILPGGGYSTEQSYPLHIQGLLQSGYSFYYDQFVDIVEPNIVLS